MGTRPTFTIGHGYVASIAMHALLVLPFVQSFRPPPDKPPLLVVELQGLIAETQFEERVLQEASEANSNRELSHAASETPSRPLTEGAAEPDAGSVASQLEAASVGSMERESSDDKQVAQTVERDRD